MKAIFIISMVSLLASCSSIPSPNAAIARKMETVNDASNVITFKVNGEEVRTSGWTISRVRWGIDPSREWLNITTNMHDERRTIMANLNGAVPGVYALKDRGALKLQSHADYKPDYNIMMESYSFISGSFNITQVDTVKNIINGTFAGIAENTKGERLTISDGKIINGTLKRSVTQL